MNESKLPERPEDLDDPDGQSPIPSLVGLPTAESWPAANTDESPDVSDSDACWELPSVEISEMKDELEAAWDALMTSSEQVAAENNAEVLVTQLRRLILGLRPKTKVPNEPHASEEITTSSQFAGDTPCAERDNLLASELTANPRDPSNKEKEEEAGPPACRERTWGDGSLGEDLLISMACEDKSSRASTLVVVSVDDLADVLADAATRLSHHPQWSPFAAAAIIDAFVMQMTQLYLFVLVEAREKEHDQLALASRRTLVFLSECAHPRELHVMVKAALSRITNDAYITVCSHILEDLLDLWTNIIPRITGKRGLFVKDVIEMLDKLIFNVTTHDFEQRPASIDSEEPSDLERKIFQFVVRMSQAQQAQDTLTNTQVEKNGSAEQNLSSEGVDESSDTSHADASFPSKDARVENKEESLRALTDHESEQRAVLALLFKLLLRVMRKLPLRASLGPGDAIKTHRSIKTRQGAKVLQQIDAFLQKFPPLFRRLGFDNPVHACQMASKLLGTDPLSPDDLFLRDVSCPKPNPKRKPETYFNLNSMGCYLLLVLLPGENMDEPLGERVRLKESAFAYLDPEYAMRLVLPFVMNTLTEPGPELQLRSLEILAGFLDQLPQKSVMSYLDAVRSTYGTSYGNADVSWFGLGTALMKAVGVLDDFEHRKFAYMTLKRLLNNFASASVRFSLVGTLLLQTDRPAVAAQLITELKDSLQMIDQECTSDVVDEFRNKLADTFIPRFLMPRKEFLAGLNPAIAACNAGLYLAIVDSNEAAGKMTDPAVIAESGAMKKSTENLYERMILLRRCLALGRESMRAVAAVAEHDQKTIPGSKLAKADLAEAKSLYGSAGRTLNDCLSAISTLELAINRLDSALENAGESWR